MYGNVDFTGKAAKGNCGNIGEKLERVHVVSGIKFYKMKLILTCLRADKPLYAGIIYAGRAYNSATEAK
jgi:hypothetical protein